MAKKGSYFLSKTDKIDTTIEFCIFELVFVSNFTLNNFEILDQIYPRKIFMVENRKVNIIIEFHIFKLVLVPNFSLNWQFWFFWPDLPKKGFSGLKQKKRTPHIFSLILHILISLVQHFSSSDNFNFLDQICTKMYFWSKTENGNIIIEIHIFKLVSWYQISALTDNFDFFDQIYPKRVFLV